MNESERALQSFHRGLAAAVVHPGLRSVLLLDADAEQFEHAAACVREMLDAFTQVAVEQVSLGAYHHDEQLWDGDAPLREAEGRRGLLVQRDHVPGDRLILIRDLSSLSVEAVRACVQLMDAPVAHLERHGQRHTWTPRVFWLAACRREAAGHVSGHLLDRFALRLNPHGWSEGRLARLRSGLAEPEPHAAVLPKLRAQVVALRKRLKQGTSLPPPPVSEDLLGEVLDRIQEAPGLRRQLGLARLAAGLARLDHARLDSRHIHEAAQLSGLPAARKVPDVKAVLDSAFESASSTALRNQVPTTRASLQDLHQRLSRPSTSLEIVEQLRATETIVELAQASLSTFIPAATVPVSTQHGFPEDEAPIDREHATLRRVHRSGRRTGTFGPIVGVQRTSRAEEIAMLPTILAAAPYQALRRARHPGATEQGWLIHETDWRSYRRAVQLERMLVLLLDLTSMNDCLFELVPYLHEAYVESAAVRVVIVGAANASSELRAEVVSARNVLAPELRRAFDAGPGRATPLAHGLSLATKITREHCFRGRGPVHGADVVIASDGLGNIPLSASQSGTMPDRVTREGIDDALSLAEELRNIRSARIMAVPPKRLRAKSVFASLVDALGAEVHPLGKSTGSG